MTWRYVAFHARYVMGDMDDEVWTIREAYYDQNGQLFGISAAPQHPSGETAEELLADLKRMANDIQKHAPLTPKDVPGYRHEEYEVPVKD